MAQGRLLLLRGACDRSMAEAGLAATAAGGAKVLEGPGVGTVALAGS